MRTATALEVPLGCRHNNASGTSAFHDLVFTTCHPAKEEVGWPAMGCKAQETFLIFFPSSLFYSTLCIMSSYRQNLTPLTADVTGGASLSQTPKGPYCVCMCDLSKNSRLKRQCSLFFNLFIFFIANDPNFSVYILYKHTASAYLLL